jgi:hypothetical protein
VTHHQYQHKTTKTTKFSTVQNLEEQPIINSKESKQIKNIHSDSLATQKENKATTTYDNNNDKDNNEESNIETDVDDDSIYCENDYSTDKKPSSKQSSSKGISIIGAV